tara:strand:+ start:25910 stop:26191 length:282 start_codon:yes stop_codon:yes gene_type:complete
LPAEALAKEGGVSMHNVCYHQSVAFPDQYYTGLTNDVQARLAEHNAGKSRYTAKFKPWMLLSFHYFVSEETALAFEKYLKTGSGRALARKRFR